MERAMMTSNLLQTDPEVFHILKQEDQRQEQCLEMIASENFVSQSVMEANSSSLTNKYAEGYPGKRYYHGCEYADQVETLAIERLKKLFKADFANVQPHSGAQANMAAFLAFLNPGDTILGMELNHGGHLTHGSPVNFSGRTYHVVSYGVRREDQRIDYDQIASLAREHKPKLIIAGSSTYPRVIDFAKFREIADETKAILLADIAHIAGLVATEEHPSPMDLAHIISSTTHKTLRGPRGGFLLTNSPEYARLLNSRIFPGTQGGPLMHTIAAKAVSFQEALQPDFRVYIRQVKENARILAETLVNEGFSVVTGGTDNHIVLLDLSDTKLTGSEGADILHSAGITANQNTVPFDKRPPRVTSGIRFGSPALTTRGMGSEEFQKIGHLISMLLNHPSDTSYIEKARQEIKELIYSFPLSRNLR